MQNFRKCIEEQQGLVYHSSVLNIYFKDDVGYGSSVDPVCVEVEYPEDCNGWTITPNRSPCKVKLIALKVDGLNFIVLSFIRSLKRMLTI